MRAVNLLAMLLLVASGEAFSAPSINALPFWDASDESDRTIVDHSVWGAFLAKYIVLDDSGINKVAYGRVSESDRDALGRYLTDLAAIDPRRLRKVVQFAYWINLYNALTVEVVLRNPGKGTILRMGEGLLSIGPGDDELLQIAEQPVTLNDIEHRILRPIFHDRRLHYAINCASLGCPNLVAEPYTAQTLEALVSAAERAYINHARAVRIDARGRLYLSKIFGSYRDDFAADERALLAYLAEHHETLGDSLRTHRRKIRYHYDWGLNDAG